eukprot:CAMPEP_0114555756 /NCGR_PEP_ID=MMETSP0114-20121206/8923_1 /TAXON_ID=31324 /ORGANISM="Goniomonas sp, Strain m" /LENGTH=213 /DNA_ID=CAMNT_0001740911 /DNA_START=71 /DNA_END=712 /DNA_ORIENTATION=+
MASKGGHLGYDYLIKLMLIGDSGVGKSSLLLRFSDDTFDTSGTPTIGIDFKLRTIELDNKRIKLQLLDTAGQERFRTITTAHYRNAMGILLVYDVTKEDSFNNIHDWLKNIERHTTGPINKILIGNKCDLDKREVSTEKGKALADELGMGFFETSAKDKTNVENSFISLTRDIQKRLMDQQGPKPASSTIVVKPPEPGAGGGGGGGKKCCGKS